MSSTSSKYRKEVKETDPDRYKLALEKQKLREAKRRAKLRNELQKIKPSKKAQEAHEKIKEQSRKRQREYRQRKKLSQNAAAADNHDPSGGSLVTSKATCPERLRVAFKFPCSKFVQLQTRKGLANQRAYWKEKKREQRSRMSSQKKRRLREKDRNRKAISREEERANHVEAENSVSQKTTWNVTANIRKQMPKGPKLFADVVNGLIANSSPKKRKAMEDKGLTPPSKRLCLPKLSEVVKLMSQKKEGMAAAKLIANTARKIKLRASARVLSSSLGLNTKTILRARKVGVGRVCRKDKISKSTVQIVDKFFKMEHISRPLPQKRFATKTGPGYVLQISLKAAYQICQKEYPNIKIGYTKFTLLRPRNVRLLSSMIHEVCMCVYCLNVKYKLLALNRLVTCAELKVENERNFMNVLLCSKSDGARYHKAACVWGKCECKGYGNTINEYYKTVIEKNPQTIWNHWERKSCDDGKIRRVLVAKQDSAKELVDELIKDIECPVQGVTFIEHVFVASWQYYQYNQLKNNLPKGWILMVMDFAQNRKIFFQDEIKAAHFSQKQITMHPIVVYRKDDNDHLIRESLVFLSDDTGHDSHAVEFFLQGAIKHMEENTSINRIVIFSDGCASQYKGKINFADVSLASYPTERNYYGSEHGKGEGDGEIGVINRAIDRAVLGRQVVIRNSQELHDWCSANIASDAEFSKRKFFHVKVGDVARNRPDREVETLKGSRKLHQIQANGAYSVKVRKLSCFCGSCKVGGTSCINTPYVGIPSVKTLKRATRDINVSNQNCVDYIQQSRQISAGKTNESKGPDSSETSGEEHEKQSLQQSYLIGDIQIEQYYAVFYDSKPYFGRVLAIDGAEVQIKFLHSASSTSFAWPKRDDITSVNKRLIFFGPVEILGHGPFHIQSLQCALDRYASLRKQNKLR